MNAEHMQSEIPQESQNNEWEQIKVSRAVSYSNDPAHRAEYSAIRRKSDGFTCISRGRGREMQEDFVCETQDGIFAFCANRWIQNPSVNREDYIPTNRYIVHISMFLKDYVSDQADNEKKLLFHAKDIDSALKNLPPRRVYDYDLKPVSEVVFDLSRWGEAPRFARIEDL